LTVDSRKPHLTDLIHLRSSRHSSTQNKTTDSFEKKACLQGAPKNQNFYLNTLQNKKIGHVRKMSNDNEQTKDTEEKNQTTNHRKNLFKPTE